MLHDHVSLQESHIMKFPGATLKVLTGPMSVGFLQSVVSVCDVLEDLVCVATYKDELNYLHVFNRVNGLHG